MLATTFIPSAAQMTPLPANRKLQIAEDLISHYYVEPVDRDTIVDEAIRAMLKTLDPHSIYSTPEETKELNEPLNGNFSGVGISFNMASDTLYVISTISGGPSERVGILPGDRIIEVDDTIIAGVKMKNSDVMRRLPAPIYPYTVSTQAIWPTPQQAIYVYRALPNRPPRNFRKLLKS